jgi:polysaccharide biosynthesis transport protein
MSEMADYSVNSNQFDGSINIARLLRISRKRWLAVVAVSATVFAGVAAYTFTRTPLYESTASILIDKSTIAVSELPIPDSEGNFSRDGTLSTEMAILSSRSLVKAAVSKLKNPYGDMPEDKFLAQVSKNLSITQVKNARVLRINYRDPDPQRAKDIITSLTTEFTKYSQIDKRSKSRSAIKFVEMKLPQMKKQLDRSGQQVTEFRRKYNIVDPDIYASSVYGMKQALETQAQELQIKMAQTQKQFQELQRQVGKSANIALGGAILTQDTTYQTLVKQFQEAETNYFLERTRYQANHPTVVALKDRRDQLYKLMQVQAEEVLGIKANLVGVTTEGSFQGGSTIKQNLANQLFETQTTMAVQTAQMGSIRLAQRQISGTFAQIPQLQQTFTGLQRQLALDSSIFTKLSEKLEELRISEAQEIASWRVLDSAFLPVIPVSPNILLNLLLGGFGGILMGVALVMFLEKSDQRIREIEEVRELTDVPLLGAVPRTDMLLPAPISDQPALAPSYSHSAFKEALRSLALNLRYLGSDQSVKAIMFTSAIPSEGKSTLIYNLGMVLAELGHKVLVVDADMRRPTIHKLARVRNTVGLSTAIATNRHWKSLVQSPTEMKGYLHVIPSGPLPPNPIALLESTKMTKLLQVWRQTYDYVLIDTPPIVGITDAQSLASKVDSVVLVAAIERSTRSAIARAVEILGSSHCNIAGILLNMIDKGDRNYYYSYYSSYYGQPRLLASTLEPTKAELEPVIITRDGREE